ncbi:MAG: hypothetical protein NTY36_10840 [Deltaproteobacteria bacterium]|nr:hypothetical protein [Deltaproteobacteria bacterium]
MAKMGRRKITKAKLARTQVASETNPFIIPVSGGLNILIPETEVVIGVAWGFEQPPIGLPIMREGFITTTGLLQSSIE